MKKIKFGKDILVLTILTLVTTLTWIGFDVYKALTKTEIPKVLKKQTQPLKPQIATKTIKKLESRISFSPQELNETTIFTLNKEETTKTSSEPAKNSEITHQSEATESGRESTATESGKNE